MDKLQSSDHDALIRLITTVQNMDMRFTNWTIEHGKEHAETSSNTRWLIGIVIAIVGVIGPAMAVIMWTIVTAAVKTSPE